MRMNEVNIVNTVSMMRSWSGMLGFLKATTVITVWGMMGCKSFVARSSAGNHSLKALTNDEYVLSLKQPSFSSERSSKVGEPSEQIAEFTFEVCHKASKTCINPFYARGKEVTFLGSVLPINSERLTSSQRARLSQLQEVQDKVAGIRGRGTGSEEVAVVGLGALAAGFAAGMPVVGVVVSGVMISVWAIVDAAAGSSDYIDTESEKALRSLREDLKKEFVIADSPSDGGSYQGVGIEKATVVVHFSDLMSQDKVTRIQDKNMAFVVQALAEILNEISAGSSPSKTIITSACIHDSERAMCREVKAS